MSIEAMKLAIKALENTYWSDFELCSTAMNALRQAIEEAEQQKPVAWYAQDNLGDEIEVIWNSQKPSYAEVWIPLYTAPLKLKENT